jgi:hypothetical protein
MVHFSSIEVDTDSDEELSFVDLPPLVILLYATNKNFQQVHEHSICVL